MDDAATWTEASSVTVILVLSCQILDSRASTQMSAVKTHCGVSGAVVQTQWVPTSALARWALNLHQTEPFAGTSMNAGRRACATMASASTLRVASNACVILVMRHKEENVWTSMSASATPAWVGTAPTPLAVSTVSAPRVSPWAAMDVPVLTANLDFAMQFSNQGNAAIPRPRWSPSQHVVVVELSFPMYSVGALRVPLVQALAARNTINCAHMGLGSPTVETTSTNVPRSPTASVSMEPARI